MSDRKLPDWIDSFMEYTQNSEPPDLFRLWVGISVVASALQRKCHVDWGMLKFYPNLYVILVGPSGTRKGTAMYPGQDLLRKLGVSMAADATTLQALIRRLKETTNTVIDPKTSLPKFHSSMTIFSKEFTVFLGYKNDELIASLCDWYDCDSQWTYDTKNQGTDEILGVWVNLIGATTPDLIQSSMPLDAIGGGLTSRIIFVCEQNKGKTVAMPWLTSEELKLKDTLYQDLEQINLMSGKFKFTEKFARRWVEWYEETSNAPLPFDDRKFAGYCHRRPNHLMKLSMIMCASRSSDMLIEQADFERALQYLLLTEKKMPRVFAGVGQSDLSQTVGHVLAYIKMNKTVSYQQLMAQFYTDADYDTMERIVKTLDKMGAVKVKLQGESPTSITYIGGE